MAKFSDADIDLIEFDLTKWRPAPDSPGVWAGVVPEPSGDAIQAYLDAVADVRLASAQAIDELRVKQMKERRDRWAADHGDDGDAPDEQKLLEADSFADIRRYNDELAQVRRESQTVQRGRLIDALAEFCQDTPGRDVLQHLPYRVLEGFAGFVSGFFLPAAVRNAASSD